MTYCRNLGNEKYIQNFGRLETTSEYSSKSKDNIENCFEEIRCENTDYIEVSRVRFQRWRRAKERNTWFSLILCIISV